MDPQLTILMLFQLYHSFLIPSLSLALMVYACQLLLSLPLFDLPCHLFGFLFSQMIGILSFLHQQYSSPTSYINEECPHFICLLMIPLAISFVFFFLGQWTTSNFFISDIREHSLASRMSTSTTLIGNKLVFSPYHTTLRRIGCNLFNMLKILASTNHASSTTL